MNVPLPLFTRALLTGAGLLAASAALAKTLTVNAQDNIYGTGQATAPGGGNVPAAVLRVPAGAQCLVVESVRGATSCSSAQGCMTLNDQDGSNLNDPDGLGAYPTTSSNTGAGSISGITAPYAGYLVGLFTPRGGPSGTSPASLDYTQTGTGFAKASPLIDQVFFIGDGKTGDGGGKRQVFVIPAGAKAVTFGISDACDYNGAPGCYTDNQGSYSIVVRAEKSACK